MRGAAGGVGASGRAGRDGTLKRPMRIYMALWALGAAVAVGGASPPATRAGGRAARVVSFSPGITRILFDMGLGGQVVGVTRFCRLDPGVRRPRVGDAFHISTEAILAVRPDVIFAQTSPEKFQGVRAARPDVTVVELRLEELADVPAAIRRIGEVLGRGDLAAPCGAAFRAKLEIVRRRGAGGRRPRVLFVMGTDRPTVAGAGNFIGDLIEAAGGVNAGADIPGVTRWRRTHIDAIARARPDVLICQTSAKGAEADAREYWLQWKDLPAAAAGRVVVVNEPEWSIPGTHLADLGLRLAEMIHPPEPAPSRPSRTLWQAWVFRLLAAAVVGAALAAGGMALQGLLRNPLAEPYILGVSSGAGVGVLLGMAAAAWWAVPAWASTPLLAFAGAMATCAVVYAVAQRRGRLDPYSLILSGVIVNTFNAAIMLTIYLYIDPHRIADFAHWAMGRLPDSVDRVLLIVCAGCIGAGWLVLLLHAAALNVLGLGDAVASSSGVAVQRLRLAVFLAVGLMTAAAVALAGPIGFLGLIVPHICRMVVGPEHRRGVLASALAGAVFLVLAETLCRRVGPYVGVSLIPVGILTALTGGPFFIYLLRKRFREMAA